jgi:hypothetical protein
VAGLATGGQAGPTEEGDAIAFAGKPLTNAALGLFLLGCGAGTIWGFLSATWPVFIKVCLILVSGPIFIFYAAWCLRSVRRGRWTMIAIGTPGIFDWRLSSDWIPWSAVRKLVIMPDGMYGWFGYGRYLSVEIDPVFKKTFRLTPFSRAFLLASFLFQFGIVPINPNGTEGTIEEMTQALDRYFPQWRKWQDG